MYIKYKALIWQTLIPRQCVHGLRERKREVNEKNKIKTWICISIFKHSITRVVMASSFRVERGQKWIKSIGGGEPTTTTKKQHLLANSFLLHVFFFLLTVWITFLFFFFFYSRFTFYTCLASCRYEKSQWTECNPETNVRTRTLSLKKGVADEGCIPTRTIQKKCKKGKYVFIFFSFLLLFCFSSSYIFVWSKSNFHRAEWFFLFFLRLLARILACVCIYHIRLRRNFVAWQRGIWCKNIGKNITNQTRQCCLPTHIR